MSETKPETARDNIFNPYNSCTIDEPTTSKLQEAHGNRSLGANTDNPACVSTNMYNNGYSSGTTNDSNSTYQSTMNNNSNSNGYAGSDVSSSSVSSNALSSSSNSCAPTSPAPRKRQFSSNNLDNDLEKLDRELSAIGAPMPLIDPEITQGAEQLEKAISSRKRLRSEDESDRLVREALSQFYIPPQRLISAIEDCPLDVVSASANGGLCGGMSVGSQHKRPRLSGSAGGELELEFELHQQNQKEFEVIMDALRLNTPSPTPSVGSDSCGQAAMMGETGVFHNLVVTSLET